MQNDKRNAMNEYVQRIENFSLLCMCSAQRKEERQFLASEKKLQRVLVNVSRRRCKGRHRCAYAYARACERISLSSVVHISVVRCTLFCCLRQAQPGRARQRRIPQYRFFFLCAKRGRRRVLRSIEKVSK